MPLLNYIPAFFFKTVFVCVSALIAHWRDVDVKGGLRDLVCAPMLLVPVKEHRSPACVANSFSGRSSPCGSISPTTFYFDTGSHWLARQPCLLQSGFFRFERLALQTCNPSPVLSTSEKYPYSSILLSFVSSHDFFPWLNPLTISLLFFLTPQQWRLNHRLDHSEIEKDVLLTEISGWCPLLWNEKFRSHTPGSPQSHSVAQTVLEPAVPMV